MQQKHRNINTKKNLEEFLEYRNNLTDFDKKMEAGTLIHKVESVDVNKAFNKVNRRINQPAKTKQLFTSLTKIAAVLTIPLLMLTIWSLFLKNPVSKYQADLSWQEMSSPAGMRSQIVLPDGTKLWLNAQSTIRYSIPFVKQTRTIELFGEAFLEVSKNKKSPFIVLSENTSVEVLGTQFNVKAYPEEDIIEVALAEGKVKFSVDNEKNKNHLELTPGDFLVFNKNNEKTQLQNTNIEKHIAWHQNILILDETPLEEVAVLLQRWYGVQVIIQNEELKRYKFTTTFENESLFRVLELLELSSPDIKINYTPGKINDNKNLSQSTVEITLKK